MAHTSCQKDKKKKKKKQIRKPQKLFAKSLGKEEEHQANKRIAK